MRGDPFQQGKADFFQFLRVTWYQTFGFKILLSSNKSFRASHILRDDSTSMCDCIELMGVAYLDIEVLVNLERLAEEEYELH